MQRDASSASAFSTMTNALPINFAGARIEFRGFLKTDSVAGTVALWLREDGDAGSVAFDNMQTAP